LQDNIDDLEETVEGISSNYLKNINVNGVEGTVANNIATVTIDTDDIKLGTELTVSDTTYDTTTTLGSTLSAMADAIKKANEAAENAATTAASNHTAVTSTEGSVEVTESATNGKTTYNLEVVWQGE